MDLSEAERKFINEGAAQYLDALRALREFRGLILGLCGDVVRQHAQDLARAMGNRIDTNSAYDEVVPKDDALLKVPLNTAWTGRRLVFPDFGNAYWGLLWELDGTGLSKATVVFATVGYETQGAAARDRALPRFRQSGVATIENSWRNEVDIRESLHIGEIDRFSETLGRLTADWIKIWQYVGGVQGIAQ